MKTLKRKASLPMFDMRAGFQPGSFNKEKRTVDVIFTTGASVLRSPWFGEPYYEELEISEKAMRMDRLNSGAPLLNNHSNWSLEDVIGVVERAWIENGVGMATVRLSEREELAGIVKDIETGIIRNISVGYMVHRFEKQTGPEGVETEETPVYRAVDWEPMELSFVGIPADAGAQSRSDGALELRAGTKTVECELVNNKEGETSMKKKRNADGTETVETAVASEAAPSTEAAVEQTETASAQGEPAASSPETEGARGAQPQTSQPDAEAIRAAEVTRQADIRSAVRVARLDESFADALVKDTKMTIEGARAAIFAKMEEQSNEVRTSNNLRVEGAGMEQQIARREAATRILLHQFNPSQFKLKDGDNEMRAHGLLGMARKILQMEGVRGVYDMSPKELSERALHTTSDFPLLLANLANKSLMAGYEQAASTFEPFVREISVPDFKDIASVRLSSGGPLQKVNEHGEFKRGSLVEAGGKYAVDTYGLIIGATRKLLMNDDLNAFTSIPNSLGLRAKQSENNMFWQLLLSNPIMDETGQALFSVAHGNIVAAGAPDVAKLGEARAKLRLMLDLDKQPINISASYLVVPTALETAADQLVTPITPATPGTVNPFINKLQPLAEPRLDANSVSKWYVMSDKQKVPMAELARIDGQGPKITVREGFDIDGMETKISYDFGMKIVDYRGFILVGAP